MLIVASLADYVAISILLSLVLAELVRYSLVLFSLGILFGSAIVYTSST